MMKSRTVLLHKTQGYGPMYRAIAKHQRAGRTCAVLSLREPFDLVAAKAAGVDVSRLLVSEPETPAQAEDIGNALKRSGAVDRCYHAGQYAQ